MTTNRKYLKMLRDDLFDATLMGLMGLPLCSEAETKLKEWLDSPLDKRFEECVTSVNHITLDEFRGICELGESKQQINSEDK